MSNKNKAIYFGSIALLAELSVIANVIVLNFYHIDVKDCPEMPKWVISKTGFLY